MSKSLSHLLYYLKLVSMDINLPQNNTDYIMNQVICWLIVNLLTIYIILLINS